MTDAVAVYCDGRRNFVAIEYVEVIIYLVAPGRGASAP
jgi:hypothetical protein